MFTTIRLIGVGVTHPLPVEGCETNRSALNSYSVVLSDLNLKNSFLLLCRNVTEDEICVFVIDECSLLLCS